MQIMISFKSYALTSGLPIIENINSLKGFARQRYVEELCIIAAEKKGYLKNKNLSAKLDNLYNFILANDYMRYVGEKGIKITESEIESEYNTNKLQFTLKNENNSLKPIQLSYNEAKPFIIKKLITKNGKQKTSEWRNTILKKNELNIISQNY